MNKYLLSALLLALPFFASAQEVEIDGVCYNLFSGERFAEVSRLNYNLGEINWSSDYRFASQDYASGEECYAVPMDVWGRLKTETFYATIKGDSPMIYLTDGWWSNMFTGNNILPGSELLADNGDGTWTLSVNFAGDPILDVLDTRHLLFTGSGYTVENIYLKGTFAGDDSEEITYVWKNGTYQSDAADIPEIITYEGVEYTVMSIVKGAISFNGLTSVTIPKSVIAIASPVFGKCRNLKSVKVESGNPKYDSREDCNAIIETNSNRLIAGCQTTVIPNSVTGIGEFAFAKCGGLTAVTIPNSVTTIEESAFAGCGGLTSVTIPNSVTSIGVYAFGGCSGLASVTIPNSVTSIGTWAFSNCMALESVIIPNSVTSIGSYTFAFCWNLASVTIPSSVTSIGSYAFETCRLKDFYCYAGQVPDTSDGSLFQDVSLGQATLHVPAPSISDYRSTSPWSGFMNIVALTDGAPSGIKQTADGMRVSGDQPIYNLNGQRVSHATKGILIKNGRKYIVK